MYRIGIIEPLDGMIGEMDGPSLMLEKEFSELEIGQSFVFDHMDFIKICDETAEPLDRGSIVNVYPSFIVKVESI